MSKKSITITATIAIVTLLALAFFFLNLPKREDDIAEIATESFLKGDLWALYQMSSPEEKSVYKLEKQKVDHFSDTIFNSLTSTLKRKTKGAKDYSAPTAQGSFNIEVETNDKKEVIFGFQVTRTKNGSYVQFSHVLIQILRLQAHQNPNLSTNSIDELKGQIEIIESQNTLLSIAGIPGMYSNKSRKLSTWSEVAERYGKIIDQVQMSK